MKTLVALVFLFSLGCVSKHKMVGKPFVNEENGLEGRLIWIKNKVNKMDVNISLKNKYPHAVVVQDNAVSIVFNGQKNATIVKTNERMVLRKGDTMNFVSSLGFSPKLKWGGVGQVIIDHVYSYKNDEKGKKLKSLTVPFKIKNWRTQKED